MKLFIIQHFLRSELVEKKVKIKTGKEKNNTKKW